MDYSQYAVNRTDVDIDAQSACSQHATYSTPSEHTVHVQSILTNGRPVWPRHNVAVL